MVLSPFMEIQPLSLSCDVFFFLVLFFCLYQTKCQLYTRLSCDVNPILGSSQETSAEYIYNLSKRGVTVPATVGGMMVPEYVLDIYTIIARMNHGKAQLILLALPFGG